jgi:plastocyanin
VRSTEAYPARTVGPANDGREPMASFDAYRSRGRDLVRAIAGDDMTRSSRTPFAASAIILLAVGILGAVGSPVEAAGRSVSIVDYAFSPSKITIRVGDTITWRNVGKVPHDVYFSTFHSPMYLDPEQSYTPKPFTKAGTYRYTCILHDMHGTVVVKGPAPTPKPTPKPMPKPTAPPTLEPTPTTSATPTTSPTAAAPTAASPTPSPVAVASDASPDRGSTGSSTTGPPLLLLAVLLVAGALGLGWSLNRRRR